jgi:hypothetical protein
VEYRFEILKILYEKRFAEVNLRPQIMKWINDGHPRNLIADTLNQLREKQFIVYLNPISLTANTNGAYRDDDLPISITIRNEGVEEYTRLDRLYNPINESKGNNYHFHKDFKGNFQEGNVSNSSQTYNETIPSKMNGKPKWLTLNFYWEEVIKSFWKWLIGIIVIFLLTYFGCELANGKQSNKNSQPQEQNRSITPTDKINKSKRLSNLTLEQ